MSRGEGFAAVPTWMIRDRRVPRNAILVYASLSSRAGLGAIFPSQVTIAEESGLSDRTVRRMVKHLEEIGVIERHSRRGSEGRSTGKTDAYSLHPNGQREGVANLSGRLKGPDTKGQGTGHTLQGTPLIEVDIEEVDIDSDPVATFDDFWSVWPRKDAKKNASAAWLKAIKRAAAQVILDAAIAYASHPHRPEKQFVPHAATWLNGDRWMDPLPDAPRGRLSSVDVGRAADAILAGESPSHLRALS